MPDHRGRVGFGAELNAQLFRGPRTHRVRDLLRTPMGRLLWTRDPGDAKLLAHQVFATNLHARHYRAGRLYDVYDLGSGKVTNVGTQALANDWNVQSGNQVLKLANQHATGIGTTSAANTDIALGNTTGAPAAVGGVQSLQSTANTALYRSVGTVNYTSALAITEWGLFTNATLSVATGSPFTTVTGGVPPALGSATTATTLTNHAYQNEILVSGTVWALLTDSSTTGFTTLGWFKTSDGTLGSNPGGTAAYTIQPVMWDHKVFSALNTINGDSIVWTYSLTVQPEA